MATALSNFPPPVRWQRGRRLRGRPPEPATHDADLPLQTGSAPGSVEPAGRTTGWCLQPCGPAADRGDAVWFIAQGLVLAAPRASEPHLLFFASGPGVWVGHVRAPQQPVLVSATPSVQQAEGRQWLDFPDEHVVLLTRPDEDGTRFVLATARGDHAAALQSARAALDRSPAEWLAKAAARRTAGWAAGRLSGEPVARLRGEAIEAMFDALRPPTGSFSHHWSESAAHPGLFALNELLPLIEAWRRIDIATAESLLRTALGKQRTDGFWPAWIRPDGTMSEAVAAWPTLATATLQVHRHGGSPQLLGYALPRLARYLEHALDRFVTEQGPAWTCPEEAFLPETFDLNLSTVDLTVLLLIEIEAFLALEAEAPGSAVPTRLIRAKHEVLDDHLRESLWNSQTDAFHDVVPRQGPIRRTTLARYLPLAWHSLPIDRRAAVLKHLGRDKDWNPDTGLYCWEPWEGDPEKPRVSALHTAFVLFALRQAGDPGKTEWFADAIHAALAHSRKHDDPPRPLIPMNAALALLCDAPIDRPPVNAVAQQKLLVWIDRYRVLGLSLAVVLLLAAISAVVITHLLKKNPTGPEMEVLSGMAERYYRDGRYEDAIAIYSDIAEHLKGNVGLHQRLANALYHVGRLEEAEEHYRLALRGEYPPPLVLRNLAVTLFRQEQYEESRQFFNELIEMYGDVYPQLAEQARTALRIIDEREAPTPLW